MSSQPRHDKHRSRAREVQHLFKNGSVFIQSLKIIILSVMVIIVIIDQDLTSNYDYNIFPTTLSNHDVIFIKVKWGPRPRWGKVAWKMNTQVLNDQRYELGPKHIIVSYNEHKKYLTIAESLDVLERQVKSLIKDTSAKQRND